MNAHRIQLWRCAAALALATTAAAQTTWTVDDDGVDFPGADFNDIQAAISDSGVVDGDTINVYEGTYDGTVDPLGKAITIRAVGAASDTIITGNNKERCVYIHNGETNTTVIEGFRITNGDGDPANGGGGVYVEASSPIISSCLIGPNNHTAYNGGGLMIKGAAGGVTGTIGTWVVNCAITGNTSGQTAAGVSVQGTSPLNESVFENCSVTSNFAGSLPQGAAGGIFVGTGASVSFVGCRVEGNVAGLGAGVEIQAGGTPRAKFIDCEIKYNLGDGLYIQGTDPSTLLTGTIVCGNWVQVVGRFTDGGGTYISDDCTDCDENGIPDEWEIDADQSLDCDVDGSLDSCQLDIDPLLDCNVNGVLDSCEVDEFDCQPNGIHDCIDIRDGTSLDCNENGIPDECDPDCNGDGIPDDCDPDCNVNGTSDVCEIWFDLSLDCNLNGVLDECELDAFDCNRNLIHDCVDIHVNRTSLDCNGNKIPDECDIAAGTSLDCNGNGIPDACDIAAGTSLDCNGNGIPDECEPDCNGDGIPDDCDPDCNENGISDICDLLSDPGLDCNLNNKIDSCELEDDPSLDCHLAGQAGYGILDECDIDAGTSLDLDGNGIPDECLCAWFSADVFEASISAGMGTGAGGPGVTQNFIFCNASGSIWAPGRWYWIWGSMSGTDPGIPMPWSGLVLPVNLDTLTQYSFNNPNSVVYPDSMDVIEADGLPPDANMPAFHIPYFVLNPALVGLTFHHAFGVWYDPPGLLAYDVSHTSNPVPFLLLP